VNADDEHWMAWLPGALCGASRWLTAGSLVLVAGAIAVLAGRTPTATPALAAFALVVALGAAQLYLAVRIEFDRAIFARAAARPAAWAGFDAALGRLGWRSTASAARTPEARAAGLRALVNWNAMLLAAQFALLLAGLWVAQ